MLAAITQVHVLLTFQTLPTLCKGKEVTWHLVSVTQLPEELPAAPCLPRGQPQGSPSLSLSRSC